MLTFLDCFPAHVISNLLMAFLRTISALSPAGCIPRVETNSINHEKYFPVISNEVWFLWLLSKKQ